MKLFLQSLFRPTSGGGGCGIVVISAFYARAARSRWLDTHRTLYCRSLKMTRGSLRDKSSEQETASSHSSYYDRKIKAVLLGRRRIGYGYAAIPVRRLLVGKISLWKRISKYRDGFPNDGKVWLVEIIAGLRNLHFGGISLSWTMHGASKIRGRFIIACTLL